ncbi:hypothetical protein NPIL_637381, partial [Nephila pilipes]
MVMTEQRTTQVNSVIANSVDNNSPLLLLVIDKYSEL